MPKSIVKRCVRPQCMVIFPETDKNKYCMCGALLQLVEIEVKHQSSSPKKPEHHNQLKAENINHESDKKLAVERAVERAAADLSTLITLDVEENSYGECDNKSDTKAYLYLLLDDNEEEYVLSNITRIGRAAEGIQVDIDLTKYAGKDVSREHAVIRKEKEGYYITNVSRNHSVRIITPDDKEEVLDYGKKALLRSEDGILLSKKIFFQFVEEA